MDNFFKKKEQANIFWKWFLKNEHRYIKIKESEEEDLLDELENNIHLFDSGIYFEIGNLPDGQKELVITVDGDQSLFKYVEILVAAAPMIPGWKFIAFKQANGFEFAIRYKTVVIDPQQCWFLPLKAKDRPDFFGIRIGIPNYELSKDEIYKTAAYIMLNSGLGELEASSQIHHLEVIKLLLDPDKQGYIELRELANYIKWRNSRSLK